MVSGAGSRERRAQVRIRGSIDCQVTADGCVATGIVRNLSGRGLFVETDCAPRPGSRLRVSFSDPAGARVATTARVARRVIGPRVVQGSRRGGIGLSVEGESPEYLRFVAHHDDRSLDRWDLASRPASAADRYRFRVLAKAANQPRLRTLVVSGASEAEAYARARAHLGRGWAILEMASDV